MKRSNRHFFFFGVLVCLWPGSAQTQESTLVSAILREAGSDVEKLSKLILEHESLLLKYPKSDFAPTVLFQLAELHQQKSVLIFQQEMIAYEEALDAYDRGESAQEPMMPRIKLGETIEYCRRIIDEFNRVDFLDKVLYKSAMAHLQEGNIAKAKVHFDRIIREFPNSSINLESHFRIGEYHFDRREYSQAIEHYRFLLGKWDNPYFAMALYKLGWSYYNISDYPNAISAFTYLIDDIATVEKVNSRTIGQNRVDLRREAVHYIASCFSEYGGPKEAKRFLAQESHQSVALAILLKMGELYERRNYYAEAIETYRNLLVMFPMYDDAPGIHRKIVDSYTADEQFEQADIARRQAIDMFSPRGMWSRSQPDDSLYRAAIGLAAEYLVFLGKSAQAAGQETGRVRDFQLAIENYEQYLRDYPHSDDAAEINYYLAESYYDQGLYEKAAEAYYDVVIKYDSTDFRQDAAYNRILCYYQLLSSDQAQDSVTIYIVDFLGTGDILTARISRQSENDLLRACNDYVRFFPDSKHIDQVLMKFGESLHELQAYAAAVKAYKKVVDLGPEGPYYLTAFLNTGQALFEGGFFSETETWLQRLTTDNPDSSRQVEKAQRLIASARFKIAENLSEQGLNSEAANLLKSIAGSASDPQFRERALFAAASQFQKTGQNVQAALLLEELGKNYPESDLADDALYRAAGIRMDDQSWTLAAADYLLLVDAFPGSEFASQALKNAALCYENVQDWYAAKKVYARCIETFSDNIEDTIECLYRSGEMSFKSGDWTTALNDFTRVVNTYRNELQNSNYIDSYFVAQAQFMLGEVHFQDYRKMELTPPLKQALQNKIAKFNTVLAHYKETLEYQVADWSTAASYRIGMAFEELVRAFMESPVPPGLDEDEVRLYTHKLEESAQPYKERALETYRRMVEQAQENQIENKWVEESRKRIEVLSAQLQSTPPPAREVSG
ncbi:tetratricopeptide repeat protein [candidate division KSB1 bacterium]|nr:tetratricopeptide repeat protein [candidate division KSB1 bacterium]